MINNIYLYAKEMEKASDFDFVLQSIMLKDKIGDIFISAEPRRSYYELEKIKSVMKEDDVCIILNLSSLGLNDKDIAVGLDWFITTPRLLVIANFSNSYLWVLCTEIANIMNLTKEEVYIRMLEDYGVSLLVPLTTDSDPQGFFKYFKYFDRGVLNGKECIWYKVFKGSSQYDSKEMAHLLNGVVQEAKNLGIVTLDELEIQEMLEKWGQNFV